VVTSYTLPMVTIVGALFPQCTDDRQAERQTDRIGLAKGGTMQ